MPVVAEFTIEEKIRVAVWRIAETEKELTACTALNADAMNRLSAFAHPRRRLQWLACRAALKAITGDDSFHIDYDRHGKPAPDKGSTHISFSHAGDLAAALFSPDLPAGLDIEEPRERIRRVRDRFLSPVENARLPVDLHLDHLYYYWCAKEALYKIHGRPDIDFQNDIHIHPFDYLCTPEFSATADMITSGTRTGYKLFFTKTAGSVLAVAYPAGRIVSDNKVIP
jgi:phosphopantetheinyl transferase